VTLWAVCCGWWVDVSVGLALELLLAASAGQQVAQRVRTVVRDRVRCLLGTNAEVSQASNRNF
jgi:hypothetical protein